MLTIFNSKKCFEGIGLIKPFCLNSFWHVLLIFYSAFSSLFSKVRIILSKIFNENFVTNNFVSNLATGGSKAANGLSIIIKIRHIPWWRGGGGEGGVAVV